MKIAILTYGSRGDVQPFLPLSLRLIEEGHSVSEAGFRELYLDANAISPQRAIRIGQMLEVNGIHFVDGGVIGGPAWKPKETWLYLSGDRAHEMAACF